MKIAYLDCFSGISGDMMLGALLDLGFRERDLVEGLRGLPVSGYRIRVSRQSRQGLEGTRVEVDVDGEAQPHRHYGEIRRMLAGAALSERVRSMAGAVFERLARAEGRVHGVDPERVHFHEVGAVDSLVDVVGAALGLEALGVDRCYVSALPLGGGFVRCAHGVLPVPAPATAALLEGMRVREHPVAEELVTPTGAAIASWLAGPGHDPLPRARFEKIGYGVGARDGEVPNLLRVFLGERVDAYEEDDVLTLCCQMDDFQPELYPPLMERLLKAGALDVFLVPVQMKKGRPGFLVEVTACPADHLALAEILFAESTTLGVRVSSCRRIKLTRKQGTVNTSLGVVQVKVVEGPGLAGPEVRPEFESCLQAASRSGVPLRRVFEEVLCTARAGGKALALGDQDGDG
jgi:pyridinium-3,5-bisthiocarboxylic acid mononucleotide nickel chelatase